MKHRYISAKQSMIRQMGGAIYSDPDNKKYSGAGIIIVTKYKGKLAIILFKGIRNGLTVYEGLGGNIDTDQLMTTDPLVSTAIREAFEESRGYLTIDPHTKSLKQYIDIETKDSDTYYRAYLLGVLENSIWISDYESNKKTLNENDTKKTMKETDGMAYFYVNDVIDGKFVDHMNNKQTLFSRTISLLNQFTESDFIRAMKNPLKLIPLKTMYIG
jgi:hypothetical protein